MNRADLTAVPVRVTSLPRRFLASRHFDPSSCLVASISYFRTPFPESTTISTRSPLMIDDTATEGHDDIVLAALAVGSQS